MQFCISTLDGYSYTVNAEGYNDLREFIDGYIYNETNTDSWDKKASMYTLPNGRKIVIRTKYIVSVQEVE